MKMNVSFPLAGFLLTASIALQGCGPSADNSGSRNVTEEGVASCKDGNFTCSSKQKEWCAEAMKKCNANSAPPAPADCTPKCTWQCESKECDQVCAPKCNQAVCSTRCKGFNTDSCQMKCGQPNCKVVCPKHSCPSGNCAACKTECGKPVCQMQCKKEDQPCRHICAQPVCNWECKKPDVCPKPKCSMKCEKPRACIDNTRIVQQLPPLEAGETEVMAHMTPNVAPNNAAASAPSPGPSAVPGVMPKSLLASGASVAHAKASTMRIEITTLNKDHSVQKAQVDLPIAPIEPVKMALTSWTKTIRYEKGLLAESEASCNSGSFQCRGDAMWCKQQRAGITCAINKEAAEAEQTKAAADAAESALEPTESMEVIGLNEASGHATFLWQRAARKQSALQP